MVTILKHYAFWKQHSRCPTCQVLMKNWVGAWLWEWFTTSGELKPNYKHVVEVGTIMKSNKESMHVLEDYPKVRDSLVVMWYERW